VKLPPRRQARTRLGRWWLGLPLRRKGALLTIVPLLVTVSVLVAVFMLQQRHVDLRTDMRAGTTTLIEASQLTEAVGEAESAVRGYAATGDPQVLAPYLDVAGTLPERLRALDRDVPAVHIAQVGEVAAGSAEAMATLGRVRDDLGATPGDDPDGSAVALGPATVAIDESQAQVDSLRLALLDDLRVQVDDSLRLQNQTQRTLIVGLLVVIATSLAGGAIIATSILGRTVRLSDNVKRYWAGEPIVPSPIAGDEIGHLAESLGQVAVMLDERQDELRESRDAAVAASRAKDEFLSRTSHELRTPLSAIIGFGQLLQLEDLNDDDRESVDHIVRAGHHLLSLIDEVLDIAKIETGNLSISVEPVAVAAVVAEATALVRAQAADRSIAVAVDTPDGLLVAADRQRLEQAVLNLLTNAVKYNRPGGRIDVRATVHDPPTGVTDGGSGGAADDGGASAGQRVRLSVADAGAGLAPDELERLFEPFERLDAAARGIDGSGVGLALSRGLVEAMGGTIGVESTVGSGSTFWIELPRAARVDGPPAGAPTPNGPTAGHRPPPGPGGNGADLDTAGAHGDGTVAEPAGAEPGGADGGPLVLYVEDDEPNQQLVRRVLRDRRGRLEVVAEGHRGVDLARRLQPGLVLLDLDLPDLGGDEVLRMLKADPATAGIPVVVVSADATPRSRHRAERDGAAAYLSKPVDVPELIELFGQLAGPRPGREPDARAPRPRAPAPSSRA
jgi:signal transduction histidine kinase/ActR/RegA family two-component response regulator